MFHGWGELLDIVACRIYFLRNFSLDPSLLDLPTMQSSSPRFVGLYSSCVQGKTNGCFLNPSGRERNNYSMHAQLLKLHGMCMNNIILTIIVL